MPPESYGYAIDSDGAAATVPVAARRPSGPSHRRLWKRCLRRRVSDGVAATGPCLLYTSPSPRD
eukprot:5335299-Alexandrium_andersonii.AAC.1